MLKCKWCGNSVASQFKMEVKGSQTGLYCTVCDRWQKWVGKDAVNTLKSMGVQMVGSPHGLRCICGATSFVEKSKPPHIGVYCAICGRWIKWKGKRGI